MGGLRTGEYPNSRWGRRTLTVRPTPEESSLLAGLEQFFDNETLNAAQRWGEALCRARNAWDVERRRKGGAR